MTRIIEVKYKSKTGIMKTHESYDYINRTLIRAQWILTHLPKKATPDVLLFDLHVAIPELTYGQITRIIAVQNSTNDDIVLFHHICNILTYDDCFLLIPHITFNIDT